MLAQQIFRRCTVVGMLLQTFLLFLLPLFFPQNIVRVQNIHSVFSFFESRLFYMGTLSSIWDRNTIITPITA